MYSLGKLFLCLLLLSLFLSTVRAKWIVWGIYDTGRSSKCTADYLLASIAFPPGNCVQLENHWFISATVSDNNTVSTSYYIDDACSILANYSFLSCDGPSWGEVYTKVYSVDTFPQQSPYYPFLDVPTQVSYTRKDCTGIVSSVTWSSLYYYYVYNYTCDITREGKCEESIMIQNQTFQVYCNIPDFLIGSTSPPSAPTPSPSPAKKETKGLSGGGIAGIVITVFVVVGAIVGFLVWRHKRGSHGKSSFDRDQYSSL